MSDTKLSARDKALVAFGAAAATHCPYWVPFHTEQLRLSGIGDTEILEAAITVQQSVGVSGYLHGVEYSVDKFKQELNSAIKYIKSQAKTPVRAGR